MNTRLLRRYLEVKGDRVRLHVTRAELMRTLRLKGLGDDDLIELSYRDPSGFVAALTYVAWRDLVANGQGNKDQDVFLSALQKRVDELKERLTERLETMVRNTPPPSEEDIP